MKIRYRIIARRQLEGERRVRRSTATPLESSLDDPMEMSPEVIDLATGTLAYPTWHPGSKHK